jgi:hypothetical protein
MAPKRIQIYLKIPDILSNHLLFKTQYSLKAIKALKGI